MKMNKGKLIVFSGPSGSGKDTVLEKLLPKLLMNTELNSKIKSER